MEWVLTACIATDRHPTDGNSRCDFTLQWEPCIMYRSRRRRVSAHLLDLTSKCALSGCFFIKHSNSGARKRCAGPCFLLGTTRPVHRSPWLFVENNDEFGHRALRVGFEVQYLSIVWFLQFLGASPPCLEAEKGQSTFHHANNTETGIRDSLIRLM